MEIGKLSSKSGILVLDTHRNAWDILLTARYVSQQYHPSKIVMPIVGYAFYVPILKQIVAIFAQRYHITFLPVYRKEELTPTNPLMRLLCTFYPKSITTEEREGANQRFILVSTRECTTPGSFVIVAPYGSPLWFGGKVKYGVRKIMERAPYIYLSSTTWSWKAIRFATHLARFRSDLLGEFADLTSQS